jgi:hypothetical protein
MMPYFEKRYKHTFSEILGLADALLEYKSSCRKETRVVVGYHLHK